MLYIYFLKWLIREVVYFFMVHKWSTCELPLGQQKYLTFPIITQIFDSIYSLYRNILCEYCYEPLA